MMPSSLVTPVSNGTGELSFIDFWVIKASGDSFSITGATSTLNPVLGTLKSHVVIILK